jgi:hypothetical protein
MLLTITFCLCASACDNGQTAGPAPSSAPQAPSAPQVPSARHSPAASAVAGASANGAAASVNWIGSYKSETGTLYVPTDVANGKEWKTVKWRGDVSGAGLGDGPITLAVDPSGRVSGTLAGPLGPALVNGLLAGDTLTASVTRQTPSDGGFVGTLVASVADGKLTGTIKVSQREASVIRLATFSAAKR